MQEWCEGGHGEIRASRDGNQHYSVASQADHIYVITVTEHRNRLTSNACRSSGTPAAEDLVGFAGGEATSDTVATADTEHRFAG